MATKKTVEVPLHMTPTQFSVFHPEHRDALDAWYTDPRNGDESEWDEDDSFSIDEDGTIVVEPGVPQDYWLWHSPSKKWVQCDDDDIESLFPGKEV